MTTPDQPHCYVLECWQSVYLTRSWREAETLHACRDHEQKLRSMRTPKRPSVIMVQERLPL